MKEHCEDYQSQEIRKKKLNQQQEIDNLGLIPLIWLLIKKKVKEAYERVERENDNLKFN